ncbi:NAD-dependent histone deacetylase SIR2 [Magnaporthiopsis poae ATCC 64411]|uniref:NAD-dependent histone deacetylase SIR2 n=1 Tax=Magnaporthiopsis poae (strain ATCC 64411 / 73-15) TaxID=644358 RepID=A0A0C4DZV3_MAGP6|nr:NAD-dependent histone deacetylase SIR2 [Magnaporthiopsis poae ATCC 64411]
MASSMRIEKRKPKKAAAAAPKAKIGGAAAAAAALFAQGGKAKKQVAANGNGNGIVGRVQRPAAPPRYPVKAEDVMDDSSEAGDNVYLEDDIKHGAAMHDDGLLAELEERGDADSICEDVIGSSVEDRFFPDIPGSCTPMEAMRLRRLLREVGPTEFVSQTVESGVYTAKKLLTAFSVRPPEFLEGAMDEDYLPFLSLAVTRELQKRAKLFQYNTVDDAVSLLQKSKNIIVLTGAGISTSLGIPDFRSKDIGLYSMLGDLGLDDPQQVFELGLRASC